MGAVVIAHYILEGRDPVPADMDTFAAWYYGAGALERRRVAFDTLGAIEVSTVFLGRDHAFGLGPPVLFETLVFGGPLDGDMLRYETYADAEAGHTAMLVRVAAAADDTTPAE
jgi:hypothetical protein